jgi:hypothetical protein
MFKGGFMSTKIENSNFTGSNVEVYWDGDGSKAVLVVAEALRNLTELFKSQNFVIEPLIVIKDGEATISGGIKDE